MADVERLVGREASRMLVPASRAIGGGMQHVESQRRTLDRGLTAMRSTLSWRITAPLRAIRKFRGR